MADTYRIILQPEAYDDMESSYAYLERDAPESAQQWAIGLMEAINSLDTFPSRCRLAPEDEYFPQEIRQLLYGKAQRYRILFTLIEDAVSILHIRHSAQDTLKP